MWNGPLFDLKCWLKKIPDKVAMKVAWKLPRKVVYWAYVRVMAHATSGPYGMEDVDRVSYSDACKRWEKGPHRKPDWFDHALGTKPIAVPCKK